MRRSIGLWIDWDEIFHRKKKNKEILKLMNLIAMESDEEKIELYKIRINLVDNLLNWKDYKSYH